MSPEAEPKFYNAVTGKNISYRDGMEIGRKVWNIQNASLKPEVKKNNPPHPEVSFLDALGIPSNCKVQTFPVMRFNLFELLLYNVRDQYLFPLF